MAPQLKPEALNINTIKRLKAYLKLFQVLKSGSRGFVSCNYIAKHLEAPLSDVENDFVAVNIPKAKQDIYSIDFLIDRFQNILCRKDE